MSKKLVITARSVDNDGEALTVLLDHADNRVCACMPLDTEILTRDGWKRYGDVVVGDETTGYNPETGRSEWTPVCGVHVYDDAPLIRLSNKTWEATCTPNHRWAARHSRQDPLRVTDEFVTADRITSRHSLRLAAEADTGEGPAISEQEAELLGWVLGDGSVAQLRKRGRADAPYTGAVSIRIYQSKTEHVKRIDRLVDGLMFNRMVRQMCTPKGESGLPLVTWEFTRGYSRELLKRGGYDHRDPVPFVLSLSPSQREAFMRGVHGAEGGFTGDGTFGGVGNEKYGHYQRTKVYYQNDGHQQDAILLGVYLSGHRPGISVTDRRGQKVGRWTLTKAGLLIRETKPFIGGEKIRREDAGRAPVWCVSTGLGTWTMRQGRQVMLTGNSFNW